MTIIHYLFTITLAVASVVGLVVAMAMAMATLRDMSDEEKNR